MYLRIPGLPRYARNDDNSVVTITKLNLPRRRLGESKVILQLKFGTAPMLSHLLIINFPNLATRIGSPATPLSAILKTLKLHNKQVHTMEQTHEDVAKADVTPEEVKTDAVSTVTYDQRNLPKVKQNRRMFVAVLLGILLVFGAFLFTRGFILAATVNGSPVSRLSVIQELEKTAGKATLETIINKKLVESELSRLNLKADVGEVSKRISELEAQITAQGGTLGEVLISEGMTMELLRKQIETTLRLEQVLAPKTLVTDEEVEAFIKTGDSPLPTGAEGDAIKLQVKNQLQQQKFQTEAQQWVADVTKEAKIKYYVSY